MRPTISYHGLTWTTRYGTERRRLDLWLHLAGPFCGSWLACNEIREEQQWPRRSS
jgi:hypothetical protein